jgi:surface antigen
MYVKANIKTNLALAPLAEAKTTPDPEAKNDDEESLLMQGQALVSGSCPVRKDPEEDGGVIIYEVQSGDTVGAIASSHNITINTILWANEMDNVNQIMPGDKIFILPISGLSYTVKKGDNLDDLVKKYKSGREKIIAFNDLPADGEIKEGQELLIPGGEKDIPAPQTTTSPSTPLGIAQRPYESFSPNGKLVGGGSGGHAFPYGYCTWYVASRKYIPWGGNAGTWLYHAKAAGYATGKAPRPGSIMVSSESWWGHVAIVESVSGGSFTVSEMNYKGWGKKSTRTIAIGSRIVKGFIYSK